MKDPPPQQTDPQKKDEPLPPTNPPKQTPDTQKKGKKKMPMMARQTPDSLKQMRQKQATDAKQLAAKNRQRAGVLKEQEKIRAAEAAEKKANEHRLRSPIPPP